MARVSVACHDKPFGFLNNVVHYYRKLIAFCLSIGYFLDKSAVSSQNEQESKVRMELILVLLNALIVLFDILLKLAVSHRVSHHNLAHHLFAITKSHDSITEFPQS
jgi:hypothetical protein